jgi:tetratricopeptide (TPR) repeat protein
MKKRKYILLIVSLTNCLIVSLATVQNTDSLWSVYNNKTQADTNRLKALHVILRDYVSNNPDSALILGEQELKLAVKTKQTEYESKALTNLGLATENKGNYPKALEYYLKALKINEKYGRKQEIGNSYADIAILYQSQTNYTKAREYFFKAIKMYEPDPMSIGQPGDRIGIAECLNNIGTTYSDQGADSLALNYYLKALKIIEETGDKTGIAGCYNNIGNFYANKSDFSKALDYYIKSARLKKELKDKKGLGISYLNVAALYFDLAKFDLTIKYCDSALTMLTEIGDIYTGRFAYQTLASAYGKTGKYKEAYKNHVLFKQLTDSIFNAENSKQLGDMKTRFEVEKREAELKVKSEAEQEKLKAIAGEEKKRQQVIIFSVVSVLVLVILFSLFLFNRFRITRKQKAIIENQKVQVDKAYESLHEKNKEVMDSINYASRIQRALLPSEKYIKKTLNHLMKK